MSKSSFVERNKAVRAAWNKERELIQEGKGTREWTLEQQKDILEKGRAYDDNGKAFEGQHMKSAEKYPEYQGNPENIQFLTRDEHLEAHDGNWQNPTNWYFNPVTKEKIDFGDGPFIPCTIIQLLEPIVSIAKDDLSCQKENAEDAVQANVIQDTRSYGSVANNRTSKKQKTHIQKSNMFNNFINGLKTAFKITAEYLLKSFAVSAVEWIGKKIIEKSNHGGTQKTSAPTDLNSANSSIAEKAVDIVEKANRSENDVSCHKQRYHTKNGVEWKEKASYHRGGNR